MKYFQQNIHCNDIWIPVSMNKHYIEKNIKFLHRVLFFVQCLKKNPLHWPSGDGILQILCQCEEYNEAYGWALRWYDKNPKYTRALNVILEIREKFRICGLDFIEK